jgi:hypothetical protein
LTGHLIVLRLFDIVMLTWSFNSLQAVVIWSITAVCT